jgi:hypothetical protein
MRVEDKSPEQRVTETSKVYFSKKIEWKYFLKTGFLVAYLSLVSNGLTRTLFQRCYERISRLL